MSAIILTRRSEGSLEVERVADFAATWSHHAVRHVNVDVMDFAFELSTRHLHQDDADTEPYPGLLVCLSGTTLDIFYATDDIELFTIRES